MAKGKLLSSKELHYIKVNLLTKSIGEIASDLGRSYYTIFKIARELNFKRNHKYTPQEDKFITKYYGSVPVSEIASKIGVNVSDIYNRARTLGISKTQKKQTIVL